jgi:hypothetical protein
MFRLFLLAIITLCVRIIKHKCTYKCLYLRARNNNLNLVFITVKIIKLVKLKKKTVVFVRICEDKTVNASGFLGHCW